jgi:hypothetical protein
MSVREIEQLYHLYCDYAGRVNAAMTSQGMRVPDVKSVTHPEFLAMWSSLSESQQEFWRQKLETGFDDVAKAQHRTLLATFASNTSSNEISSVRAA